MYKMGYEIKTNVISYQIFVAAIWHCDWFCHNNHKTIFIELNVYYDPRYKAVNLTSIEPLSYMTLLYILFYEL